MSAASADAPHEIDAAPRYSHILTALRQPWAIRRDTLDIIVEVVRTRARGDRPSDAEIRARIVGASPPPEKRLTGPVAVIPVFGVIAHRMNMMTAISGGTSTEELARDLRAALGDPAIEAIVFDVDSPGGSVQGIQELADLIYSARGSKMMVAVANATAASAAYWLASQADRLVVTPSGQVGSIGVLAVHEDISKQEEMLGVHTTYVSSTDAPYKTEGQPFAPLSDEARAELQRRVDEYHGVFRDAVARGRAVNGDVVDGKFGRGRMLSAASAMRVGMVDAIDTLDAVIAQLTARPPRSRAGLSAGRPAPAAQETAMDDTKRAEMVEPDENGQCPEGYELRDGTCHMKTEKASAEAPAKGAAAMPDAAATVKDGEIIVKLSEITALRAEAAKIARIAPLEQELERQKMAAAEFADKQRDARIAFKIREVKIPAFRGYVKGFYDMALRYAPEAARYSLLDPKVTMTAEEFVDSFVDVVNKQADVLFKTLSVDTKPVDPNEPEQISAKIEYRVTEYLRHNKLDRKKDYKTALHAVLDADPDLKDAYSRS